MRYYAAESDHGSESSYGFANDITVFVFDSKEHRDAFVDGRIHNISCKAITRKEATSEASNFNCTLNRTTRPRPFVGEYWGIVKPWDYGGYVGEDVTGLIGTLQVCDDINCEGERFYK